MKPQGSLPWIISHLQGHFPSSLYKIIITTFLKELASKMFWIFFVQRQWKKSSVKWYYCSLSELICYSSLQYFLRSMLILYSYLLFSLPELLCCIGYEVYLFKFCISFLSFQSEICSFIYNITDLTDIAPLGDLWWRPCMYNDGSAIT